MRTLMRVGVVLVLALVVVGCSKKKKIEETEPAGNPLSVQPGGAPAQGAVQRGAQRVVNQQLLRDIGQYYKLFQTENNRPPRDMKEFQAYVKADPNARKVAPALEAGNVVVLFPPDPAANHVMAYEKEAFQLHQNRLVLMADGNSVQMMVEPQFQKALKGQQ